MKALVIGSGGRESALVWKLSQSKKIDKIYLAPGNAGNEHIAERVNISAADIDGLKTFAVENSIDITIVGPEAPLVKGIVDEFEKQGLLIFGPSKQASQMEGSKAFAKKLLLDFGIPTADGIIFDNYENAQAHIHALQRPVVIKADGLAAGKGVILADNEAEALDALKRIMQDKEFGDAGDQVVIEEKLIGFEMSILAICCGTDYKLLVASQDHKPIFEGNKGPNTGGMGAYSPVSQFTEEHLEESAHIIEKTLQALSEYGINYKGILYAGLMITDKGPKVLEFNVRFGDPETQAVLPRMTSDIIDPILSVARGRGLKETKIEWTDQSCVAVVAASQGYPGSYKKGHIINGIEEARQDQDVLVFTAGCEQINEDIVTSGGRVLAVSALGSNFTLAREKAYNALQKIHFTDIFYRKDIGLVHK